MGNPPILNRGQQSPEPSPAPLTRDILWDVYVMRDKGRKLSRDELRCVCAKLTVEHRLGGLQARLTGDHGIDLGTLDRVEIRRLLPHGALLLRGMQCVAHSKHGSHEFAQAWWCMPRTLELSDQRSAIIPSTTL